MDFDTSINRPGAWHKLQKTPAVIILKSSSAAVKLMAADIMFPAEGGCAHTAFDLLVYDPVPI